MNPTPPDLLTASMKFICFANLSLSTLASNNMLPANFTSGANANPWNGNITVAPDANANYFDITLTNVPTNVQAALTSAVGNIVQTTPIYTATTGTWSAAF